MQLNKLLLYLSSLSISPCCRLMVVTICSLMDPKTKEFNSVRVKKYFACESARRSFITLQENGLIIPANKADKKIYILKLPKYVLDSL